MSIYNHILNEGLGSKLLLKQCQKEIDQIMAYATYELKIQALNKLKSKYKNFQECIDLIDKYINQINKEKENKANTIKNNRLKDHIKLFKKNWDDYYISNYVLSDSQYIGECIELGISESTLINHFKKSDNIDYEYLLGYSYGKKENIQKAISKYKNIAKIDLSDECRIFSFIRNDEGEDKEIIFHDYTSNKSYTFDETKNVINSISSIYKYCYPNGLEENQEYKDIMRELNIKFQV